MVWQVLEVIQQAYKVWQIESCKLMLFGTAETSSNQAKCEDSKKLKLY